MARVTVEDCVMRVPNRFELVLVAAQRARDVSAGAGITIDRDNDKNPVVALREIADSTIEVEALKNALVTGLQKQPEVDEPEEDRELSLGDQTWPRGAGERAIDEELKEDLLYAADEEAGEEEEEADLEAEEAVPEADAGELPPGAVDEEL